MFQSNLIQVSTILKAVNIPAVAGPRLKIERLNGIRKFTTLKRVNKRNKNELTKTIGKTECIGNLYNSGIVPVIIQ